MPFFLAKPTAWSGRLHFWHTRPRIGAAGAAALTGRATGAAFAGRAVAGGGGLLGGVLGGCGGSPGRGASGAMHAHARYVGYHERHAMAAFSSSTSSSGKIVPYSRSDSNSPSFVTLIS